MIKIHRIRIMLLSSILTSTLFMLSSCGHNEETVNTKDIAEEHNDAKFNTDDAEKDAQFLVDASEINLEEIKLAQLAQQNGYTTDAKELGKMLDSEHSAMLNELTQLANKKNITIPTSSTDKAKDDYIRLSKKSKLEFDKKFCELMVNGHKVAIALFEKASTESTDSEIKAWAAETLPSLRTHLDKAMVCKTKCDKM